MIRKTVLVLPAGSEVGLEIHRALRHCKEVRLIGGGIPDLNHGPFVFEEFVPLPSIHEEGCIEAVADACRRFEVDYIFPAYDDVIVFLAQEQARIPATILTSPLEACLITRSKRLTYEAMAGLIRVPTLFDPSDDLEFPLIVKPERGQGSQGVQLVRDHDGLRQAMAAVRDPLLCEYLPGDEYTVDCFSDRDRGVLFAGARIRRRTRNGISVNTVPVELPGIMEMAQAIHTKLSMRGTWFFQVKESASGELALLEVAPRIAGAMCLHRAMGVNFPLLSVFEDQRLPIRIKPSRRVVEVDRALASCYRHDLNFSAAYVDLDDTLLLHGAVNTEAVSFIYQCRNQEIPVVLLTRHKGDLSATLEKHRLRGMFDRVVHITDGSSKADYIREEDAILIDDSFSERMNVEGRLGIETFDPSMLEILTKRAPSRN